MARQDPLQGLKNAKASKMWKKGIQAARSCVFYFSDKPFGLMFLFSRNAKAAKIVSLLNGGSAQEISWRSFSEVGVSGIDAAMDHKSPLMRRILWSVVLLICFSLMLAQVCECVFCESMQDYGSIRCCACRGTLPTYNRHLSFHLGHVPLLVSNNIHSLCWLLCYMYTHFLKVANLKKC